MKARYGSHSMHPVDIDAELHDDFLRLDEEEDYDEFEPDEIDRNEDWRLKTRSEWTIADR